MHIHKVISSCAAAILVLSGCVSNSNTVSKSDYDDLKKEYDELKEAHAKTRDNYVNQANQMDEILNELSEITGRTNTLKLDVESGTAQVTQADEIQGNIDEIKKKLNALEKIAAKDKANQKLIGSLRKAIEEKENEIASLKEEILQKNETIRQQGETIEEQQGTIGQQKETISLQEEQLRQKIAEQAQLLLEAGKDFENLADASPEVSWKRNKRKVDDWTLEMYNKALTYYLNAQDAGNTEAGPLIEGVKTKIQNLGK